MFWLWHDDLVHICNQLDADKGLLYGACQGVDVEITALKRILGID